MHIVVLGAGVIGTTAAWFLRADGHEVTVVDRQPVPGNETSFANGGQISVSHAEPWANPSAPLKVLSWIGREDSPLLVRMRRDPAMWRWFARFLRECLPGRTHRNIGDLVRLGLYSRRTLQALRAQTAIAYDHLERGILHVYSDAREFEAAAAPARAMREHGCDLELVDAEACVALEPALAHARVRIVGGSYTPSDESGDAHRFTRALAARAQAQGVRFLLGRSVVALRREGDRIAGLSIVGVDGAPESLQADAYVMALGSHSAPMLERIGLRIPVYPAKGYSVTLAVREDDIAPSVSLTDDQYKIVISRLGSRLRCAGTAEFAGYDTTLNERRCRMILERLLEWFPRAGDRDRAQYWTGLRPATPSNLPLIGRSAIANLYLNTGHGTLGWTHACGSGRALADLFAGRRPEVEFPFMGLDRSGRSVALPVAGRG